MTFSSHKKLLKLDAHLATALARLHLQNLARRSSLEAGSKREKVRGKAEKRKKFRLVVWHGKQKIQVAGARVSRTGKLSGFATPTSRVLVTVQRLRPRATLPQEEKKNTALSVQL
jgi:triacylglycerol esterase/lipase EstA (alpha/beta hydrolase family)